MDRQYGRVWKNGDKSSVKKIILLCIFLLSYSTQGLANDIDPVKDSENLKKFFQDRFPNIPLDQYIYGALAYSKDAKSQYDSIMEFPPFEQEIDKGKLIWGTPFQNGKSFKDCFPNGGQGEAAKYPKYDESTDQVITFEMMINNCLVSNGEKPFPYDDINTMGLVTAYAKKLSDGLLMRVVISSAEAEKKYFNGRQLFFKRIGQLNLSCASCHITNAGNYFRDELISPAIGHTTHFPVFRGGEFLFTLHMRYRRCMEAMRARPFPAGSIQLNELEFFHSYLSNGLPLEASVYRK